MTGNPDILQVITGQYFQDLKIPDRRQEEVFQEFLKLAVFLQFTPGVRTVLELGAGYSTVLFAALSESRGFSFHCLDYGFNEKWSILAGTPYEALIRSRVQLHEGMSITAQELEAGWAPRALDAFLDGAGGELRRWLAFFICDNEPRKWRMLEETLGRPLTREEAVDLFFTSDRLRIPERIRKCYESLTPEMDFLRRLPAERTGLLQKVIAEVGSFDLVFFDCGEFSSWVEWTVLSQRIPVGGYAVFHDIYFPKSFKNFLACSVLMANKQWRVLYLDERTPQGLLIARRVGSK